MNSTNSKTYHTGIYCNLFSPALTCQGGPNRSWAYDEKKSVGTATRLVPNASSCSIKDPQDENPCALRTHVENAAFCVRQSMLLCIRCFQTVFGETSFGKFRLHTAPTRSTALVIQTETKGHSLGRCHSASLGFGASNSSRLIPKENSTALGTVAFLTAEQIELLDSYEGDLPSLSLWTYNIT